MHHPFTSAFTSARSFRAIYIPGGPAREYAELALNIYTGCTHACRYCYAAGAMRKRCSDKTVYRLIQEGKLLAVRIGGRSLRIPESAFYEYISGQVVNPDEVEHT
jgi:excisionase family DNA binding protein